MTKQDVKNVGMKRKKNSSGHVKISLEKHYWHQKRVNFGQHFQSFAQLFYLFWMDRVERISISLLLIMMSDHTTQSSSSSSYDHHH